MTERARTLVPPVPVSGAGHAIAVAWERVAGATGVEVDVAALDLQPALVDDPPAEAPATPKPDGRVVVAVPPGRRVRRLALAKLPDVGTHRLVVRDTARPAPLHAVPAVAARGMLPASLGGASFAAGVLELPYVAATAVELSLVDGDAPEDFVPVPLDVGVVHATTAAPASALQLVGPGGAVLWTFPGEYVPGAPPAHVDLRVPLAAALEAGLAGDGPLAATFTLKGAAGHVRVAVDGPRGSVVRAFAGVLSCTVAGAPAALPVSGLAGAPTSARADVTVRYDGLRVLEDISDAVPGPTVAIAGPVAGADPVLRALPPAGTGALPLARIGLVGRAPEECELAVSIVGLESGLPGAPLAAAATVTLPRSDTVGVAWADLPLPVVATGPAALSVRAARGRFLWAAGPGPLARFAVRDPAPPPLSLRLGGTTLAAIGAAGAQLPAQALPPGAFAGAPPALDCTLFVTVELSDLTLRYAR